MTSPPADRVRHPDAFERGRFGLGALLVLVLATATVGWWWPGDVPVSWDEPRWTATGRYYFHKFFVEHDFTAETWDDPRFTRYGTRNPPIGKYLYGAAQAVSGSGREFTDRQQVLALWGKQGTEIDRRAISAARTATAVTAIAATVLVYALAARLSGSLAVGIGAALLFLHDAIVARFALQVMTDVPVTAMCLAWLWATMVAAARVRNGTVRTATLGGLAVGAAAALAAGTKLNALLAAPVSLAWGLAATLPGTNVLGPGPHAGVARRFAAAASSAVLAGTVMWIAPNPFLYPAPVRNTATLLSYGSELVAVAANPTPLVRFMGPTPSLAERLPTLVRFADEGAFAHVFGTRGVDGALIAIGALLVAAVLAGRSRAVPRSGAALIVAWIVPTAVGLLAWTPFAWGRYYLPLEPCWATLQAIAIVTGARSALELSERASASRHRCRSPLRSRWRVSRHRGRGRPGASALTSRRERRSTGSGFGSRPRVHEVDRTAPRAPACMVIVVLPAYNEANALGDLLASIDEAMKHAGSDYAVIVVNDGSTDATGAVAAALAATMPITLLAHEQNQGLGESIRTGLMHAVERAAPTDTVVTMDADNTHTPALIERMLATVREGNDVVIASRYQPGARIKGVPGYRHVLSRVGNLGFRILFPTPNVRDFTSGYRVYRAAILKQAFTTYGEDFVNQSGFSCMVDILLKLRRLDAIITEVPLVLRYDLKVDVSKMEVLRTIGQTLRLMIARRLRGG